MLQIDVPENLPPPISIGSSAELRVGQTVLAVGNPFGLDHTLTTGSVSPLNREVENQAGGVIDNDLPRASLTSLRSGAAGAVSIGAGCGCCAEAMATAAPAASKTGKR